MLSKSVLVKSNGAFDVLSDLHEIESGTRFGLEPEVQSEMLNPGEFIPMIPRDGAGVFLRTMSVSFCAGISPKRLVPSSRDK